MANTINQVIVSPVILDKVQNNLNLANDNFQKNVTASNTTNSQVITLTVKYSNPYTAQKIANETAKIFRDDAGKLLNVTNVSILAQAKVNTAPVSPRPTLYLGASVVAGLIIGIAIAFLMEALNNKITKEEDLEALGLSVLGVTPYATESDFANVVNSAAKMPSASGHAPTVGGHTPSANSHSATTSGISSALTEKTAPRRRR
ncbi:YveK family protein [Lactococcus cremoris]|uniref:YveK family protein n=1 Tax=Lactococcus lactis subsp. cremoris TaxID=1359 RepID=UPI002FCC6000